MTTVIQRPEDSDEEDRKFILRTNGRYEVYKRRAAALVETYYSNYENQRYFVTASTLRELEARYNHFFVKKLITVAMQRSDHEKELAATLLSEVYSDSINYHQYEKGFQQLIESIDFLIIDIPDAIDLLAIFITRALINAILPTNYLDKIKPRLAEKPKSLEVIEKVEKEYLTLPENDILGKWGGEIEKPDNLDEKIKEFMEDYVETENKLQAYRDIDALETKEFNHEVVKYALLTALDRRETERCFFLLLKKCRKLGHIGRNHAYKGFDRVVDLANENKLDHIPKVRKFLKMMIVKADIDRWIEADRVKPLWPEPTTTS